MARLPVVLYPDPVLTSPTQEVTVFDDDLRRLVADMVETMHAEPGIGLAANQVGDRRRLLVLDLTAGEEPGHVHVLVNPKIVDAVGRVSGDEGCLSFPGIYEAIERYAKVKVVGVDLEQQPVEIEADDLLARVLQHEIDHLDGLTFLNRMSPLKRRLVLRRIEKLKRDGEWVGWQAS